MKIAKPLEKSGLMTKCVSETIKTEPKQQKCGFFGILLDTLATNILGSTLAGKLKITARGVIIASEGIIRAGEGVI